MIDPAISAGVSLKALGQLFKGLFFLVDRGKKQKRQIFKNVCKPLYNDLEKISKKYHGIIQKAVRRLSTNKPAFDSIIKEIAKGRDELVHVRGGVIGESKGLLEQYAAVQEKDKFGQSVYEFAKKISDYFYVSQDLVDNEYRNWTIAQGLIHDIKRYQSIPRASRKDLEALRKKAKRTLDDLERQWRELRQTYVKLKVLCET